MERFVLDEPKALEWLQRAVAAYDDGSDDATQAPPDYLPDLGSGYDPRDFDNHGTTGDLVASARHAGLLTGPGEIDWDFCGGSDSGEVGYTWHLYLSESAELGAPAARLMLTTFYSGLGHLGDRGARGAEGALSVLREAVSSGNYLLDDLDRYIAARAA